MDLSACYPDNGIVIRKRLSDRAENEVRDLKVVLYP